MKTSQASKHLGQSVALGLVLVMASFGVFVVIMMQTSQTSVL